MHTCAYIAISINYRDNYKGLSLDMCMGIGNYWRVKAKIYFVLISSFRYQKDWKSHFYLMLSKRPLICLCFWPFHIKGFFRIARFQYSIQCLRFLKLRDCCTVSLNLNFFPAGAFISCTWRTIYDCKFQADLSRTVAAFTDILEFCQVWGQVPGLNLLVLAKYWISKEA